MKKYLILSIFATGLLILSSCKDKMFHKFLANVPVYMDYEEFRASIRFEGPKPITKVGNIFKKDNYLLIVEPNQGIHFINNSNPASPTQVGFLKILGCTGVSMKDQYLYANSMIDLVVIDISVWQQPHVVSRLEDVFPAQLPEHHLDYRIAQIDKTKGVVIDWKIEETKEQVEQYPTWNNCPNCINFATMGGDIANFESSNSGSSTGTGIAGSITKFTIIHNHLYVMEGFNLHPINIQNPLALEAQTPIRIWRDVETLFPHGEHIFMGTTTGMLIYSVANPNAPNPISEVNHLTACDPVVVKDNYAYVTVRSGRNCGGEINQLDVVDITNLNQPFIAKSYPMHNPHGLGVDANLLFICDGDAGLKVFNNSNPLEVGDLLIHQFQNIQATDIIPHNNVAIMIGNDGLYQYDYSNPNDIQLLSKIPF